MKVDNFVLLIISIVTLIIISLLTECNRGRLTELENKATKEIVETFFHLGSAEPTESGQWGYKITNITEGKYGGRSRQQVINSIENHNEGDYISESEKQQYGDGLFGSTISGREEDPVDCSITEKDTDDKCNSFSPDNAELVYKFNITPPKYGGERCEDSILNFQDIIITPNDNSEGYRYLKLSDDEKPLCEGTISQNSLLNIVQSNYNEITITEPTWNGFFNSEKLSKALFPSYGSGNKLADENSITYDELQILINNQQGSENITNSLVTNYKYTKPKYNGDYYTVDDSLITREHTFSTSLNDGSPYGVSSVFVSGENLFTGLQSDTARMWDISTGNEVRTFRPRNPQSNKTISSVFVSRLDIGQGDGEIDYLFTGVERGARMWNTSTGTLVRTFSGWYEHTDSVNSVFVSRLDIGQGEGEKDYLFTGSSDDTVKMWDINATANDNGLVDTSMRTFSEHIDSVNSVFVSRLDIGQGEGEKDYLFTGLSDGTVKMWDINATANDNGVVDTSMRTFSGHSYWVGEVYSVFVSGDYLFTGSEDTTAKMWDISTGYLKKTFEGHSRFVYSVFVSGDYLFTGSRDNTAKMWNISTGDEVRTFSGHSSAVRSVFVSGGMLFTGSWDTTVKMWPIPELMTFTITH